MIVWGIDPDSKNITVGISADRTIGHEILSGGKGKRADDRLITLYEAFGEFLDRTDQPDYVYVELPVYTGNPQSTIAQSIVLGTIRARLADHGIPHSLVDNTVWKKALLGSGRATKDQIRDWIVARYGLPDTLAQDVYDALAIATWGALQLGETGGKAA